MSQQDKKDAAIKAARAASQMKHAASNVGDAAEHIVDHAKDEIVEGAEAVKENLQELTSKAVLSEVGRGAMAIGLAVFSGAIGIQKFKHANELRKLLKANA